MAAGTFDMVGTYKIEAGSRWDFTIPFVDELGAALSFTGYTTGKLTLRRDVDDLNAVAPVIDIGTAPGSGQEGVEILTGGKLRIIIDADTSAAASWTSGSPGSPNDDNRSGVLAIEIGKAAPNNEWRLADGVFAIDPEVTRAD